MVWNRAQRLTALPSREAIIHGLFSDSLLFLSVLPMRPLRIVDIGAGVGVPGIPLRIVDPEITLTMIESRRKRVSFLRTVTRELGLEMDVQIFEGRAEAILKQVIESRGKFDVAIARAVMPVAELAPLALNYLDRGGKLIASGPPPEARDDLEITWPGMRWEVREFPQFGLRRTFMIVTKEC